MFTENQNTNWWWGDEVENLFDTNDDELTEDDFDWDIGSKGGEVDKELDDDDDWDSLEYRRQFTGNGFDDGSPSGYQYDDES